MRALLLVACLSACGDNLKAKDDAGMSDAGPDATQPLRHCLDNPTEIVRPPNGQLPCDLLPPGVGQ